MFKSTIYKIVFSDQNGGFLSPKPVQHIYSYIFIIIYRCLLSIIICIYHYVHYLLPILFIDSMPKNLANPQV